VVPTIHRTRRQDLAKGCTPHSDVADFGSGPAADFCVALEADMIPVCADYKWRGREAAYPEGFG